MQNYKITFIIGPARAGTTFLAQSLLSQDIEYFEEPNIVWKHRNFHHKFEELDSSNVNKKIKDYIRNYFFSRAKKNGKQIILEKTPTNCLRLNFVQSIFPEAKFIFIERNIDDIAHSAHKKWIFELDDNTKKIYGNNVNHKIRILKQKYKALTQIHFLDLLHCFPRGLSEFSFLFFGIKRNVWGPRYDNIFQDLKSMSEFDVCLKQAFVCQKEIENFKSKLSRSAYREISFEGLCQDTEQTILELEKFIRN